MSLGGNNPFPFQVGGGPSKFERAYRALKSAVGKGGSSIDEEGIEAYWRRARALGLVAIHHDESATAQAWPHLATDLISAYEEILGTFPAPNETDEERRQEAVDLWVRRVNGATPRISEKLLELDSRISLLNPAQDTEVTGQHGRTVQPRDGTEPFDPVGPRVGTSWPNYSSNFVTRMFFDIGSAVVPTQAEQKTTELAKEVLNENLPAWTFYAIAYATDGFTLDLDLLDSESL